jgi:hypothetical protein
LADTSVFIGLEAGRFDADDDAMPDVQVIKI